MQATTAASKRDRSGVGERIRLARRRKGLSQKELAELAGCSQQTIVDIEKKTDDVRSTFLVPIVEALEEDISWITTGVGAPRAGLPPDAVLLPHFDLGTAARRSVDPSQADHAAGSLYVAPVELSASAFTAGADETSASLFTSIEEGDVLFVDPAVDLTSGRLLLVWGETWERAELRRYHNVSGRCFLEVENPAFVESHMECDLFRSLDALRAYSGDLPAILAVGTVCFIGRDV